MTRTQQWLILILAGAAAAAGGYGLGTHQGESPARASAGTLSFRLQDLDHHARTLADWKGKTVLVNFWATWCPPCRQEIPLLIKAQRRYAGQGVEVIGIAVDDPKAVRAFSARMHINYPVLLGEDQAVELMKQAGDGQGLLPYSVLLSSRGSVVATQVGAFDRSTLKHDLDAALKNP